jgi:hypothetical protein
MGLFDTIVNHYKPLGDNYIGVDLQTKSLDCTMSTYWISPAGELFMEDWADSMEMVDRVPIVFQGPPQPHQKNRWVLPWEWKPTGKHKKLTPVYYTGSVIVHPMEQCGLYDTWPEGTLLFKHGKVIYHETKTLQLDDN